MNQQLHGALCGKERQVRTRSRFSDRVAQMEIEEYLTPAAARRHADRFIPVRRGGLNDQREAMQLELFEADDAATAREPLAFAMAEANVAAEIDIAEEATQHDPKTAEGKTTTHESVHVASQRSVPQAGADEEAIAVVRPPVVRSRPEIQSAPAPVEPDGFSLTRFAVGCMIGGSAAAAMLLVAWMLIG